MAQSRPDEDMFKPVPAPIPTPTQSEIIDELKEELKNMLDLFAKERTEIANEESTILADKDVEFSHEPILPDETVTEELYEAIAPHFVSANAFLKHVLEENEIITRGVEIELRQLTGISNEEFNKLTSEEKHRYLLIVCVITDAILQDMRILANKYAQEVELCLNDEILRETVEDAAIQGGTILAYILLNVTLPVYKIDHQKEFADYRHQLYSKIGVVDLNYHEFFSRMHGHVCRAMAFIKEHKAHLNSLVQDRPEEKKEGPSNQLDAQALAVFGKFAPPAADPKADTPAPANRRWCALI